MSNADEICGWRVIDGELFGVHVLDNKVTVLSLGVIQRAYERIVCQRIEDQLWYFVDDDCVGMLCITDLSQSQRVEAEK